MNDLKSGTYFVLEGQPYEVLESRHLKMQQRRPVLQTRIKNLITGKVLERNFQQSDQFEEADIQKGEVKFLYSNREQFWFSDKDNPLKRFMLDEAIIGEASKFLKANIIVEALVFSAKGGSAVGGNGDIISIELPVKMDFEVIEAPPSIKGDTAQGGTKQVKIETGAMVNVPLFINEGDVIKVNTQTGEYAERVGKGK